MKIMELNTTLKSKQILVFRSNINEVKKVHRICSALMKIDGIQQVNVDLEDWEHVLRLECDIAISVKQVKKIVAQHGFECSELEGDV